MNYKIYHLCLKITNITNSIKVIKMYFMHLIDILSITLAWVVSEVKIRIVTNFFIFVKHRIKNLSIFILLKVIFIEMTTLISCQSNNGISNNLGKKKNDNFTLWEYCLIEKRIIYLTSTYKCCAFYELGKFLVCMRKEVWH